MQIRIQSTQIRFQSMQKPYPLYAKTASNIRKKSPDVSFIKNQSRASLYTMQKRSPNKLIVGGPNP